MTVNLIQNVLLFAYKFSLLHQDIMLTLKHVQCSLLHVLFGVLTGVKWGAGEEISLY